MEKILKIVSLKDKNSDRSFWLLKSPLERLEAIEFLRNQFIEFTGKNVQPRLQRVYTIINKKQG